MHDGPRYGSDSTPKGSELDPQSLRAEIRMDGAIDEVSSDQVSKAIQNPYIVVPKDLEEQIKERPYDRFIVLMMGFVGTRAYICGDWTSDKYVTTLFTMDEYDRRKKLGSFLTERLMEIIDRNSIEIKRFDQFTPQQASQTSEQPRGHTYL